MPRCSMSTILQFQLLYCLTSSDSDIAVLWQTEYQHVVKKYLGRCQQTLEAVSYSRIAHVFRPGY